MRDRAGHMDRQNQIGLFRTAQSKLKHDLVFFMSYAGFYTDFYTIAVTHYLLHRLFDAMNNSLLYVDGQVQVIKS